MLYASRRLSLMHGGFLMPENYAALFLSNECSAHPANFFANLQAHNFTYILNGPSDKEKSKVILKLCEYFSTVGLNVTLVKNSSDPDIADGMFIDSLQTAIIAANCRTSAVSAKSPVCDLEAELCPAIKRCNDGSLKLLYNEEAAARRKAASFSAVAAELLSDNKSLAFRAADKEKVERFTKRFCLRNIKPTANKKGQEFPCFFGAVTKSGLKYINAADMLEPQNVTLLDDRRKAVSGMIISQIKAYALLSGYDVICSYDPIFGKELPDFIIIKDIGIAVGNAACNFRCSGEAKVAKINCRRFYDGKKAEEHRERMSFNLHAADEMLYEATRYLDFAAGAKSEISDILNKYCTDNSFTVTEFIKNEIEEHIRLT